MEYIVNIQKRFTDFDIQGIVNHAVACTYVETAYINLIHELDPTWGFWNVPFVIHTYDGVHYIGIPPEIEVQCRIQVVEVGGASFTMYVQLVDQANPERVFMDGHRVLAYAPQKRASRLPKECYERLKEMQKPKSE